MADITNQPSAHGFFTAPAGLPTHTSTQPGWEPPPAAPVYRGASHTTRLLCSAVLADHRFAELVFERLCVPKVVAIAPAPGVDLVALARHAAHALDQRRHTHVALCWMLAAFVVPAVGLFVAPDLGGLWWLVILALLVGAKARAVRGDLALARRATATIDGVDIDRTLGTGLIRPDQERRLAEANTADLSVYASTRARDPFPGLGQQVDTTTRVLPPVQIDQPGDPDQPVGTVTATGLLDHLQRTLPAYVRTSEVTDDVGAGKVLYVNGTVVRHLAGLLLDGGAVPRRSAPPALVEDTADHPSRLTRTYLRAQIVGHGGQVVTTLNVAAVVEPRDLSVDLAVHVLRPVHQSYHLADRLPRTTGALVWELATWSRRGPGLLGAPGAALRSARLRRESREAPALTPEQRQAPGTQDFHGARLGLREITSFNSTFDFNQRTDAVRHAQMLMVGVITELAEYLRSQNVDISALEEQRQAIINNYVDASQTMVNGSYVTGGAGGIKVDRDLTVGSAPNLDGGKKSSKPAI
jgi:hypothetical protein